jgi:hypothetical protein
MKSSVRSVITLATLGLAGIAPGGTAGAGQPRGTSQPPQGTEQQPAQEGQTPHGFVEIIGESLSEVTSRSASRPSAGGPVP